MAPAVATQKWERQVSNIKPGRPIEEEEEEEKKTL